MVGSSRFFSTETFSPLPAFCETPFPVGTLSLLFSLFVSSELELSSGWLLDEALAKEVELEATEEPMDEVGEVAGKGTVADAAAGGGAFLGGELACNFLTSISVSLFRSILTTASFFAVGD